MQEDKCVMMVIVYVDNLIISTSLMSFMTTFKAKLENEYKMSNLNNLSCNLRIEFVKNTTTCIIIISKDKYVMNVLTRLGMKPIVS